MEALILSCATGGGHNAAARALYEEWIRRGHRAELLDPYALYGRRMDKRVGNCYVQCAQKMPRLFGGIYQLGEWYRRLPGRSPVFWANQKAADVMQEYLERHSYDAILTTHLFPGEILTHLRRRGVLLPKLFFIATDYTCIPFTEETACDYYIIPSPVQRQEFCSWGIPPEKVVPLGIPVRRVFWENRDRDRAIGQLGLNPRKRYLLMAGGSMGAGKIFQTARILQPYLSEHREVVLIVICGTNQRLYDQLAGQYRNDPQVLLLQRTEHMAEYVKACDLYLSKPGGISSTEAAAANVPLIHISPIPGCETKNQSFFTKYGMSIGVSRPKKELLRAVRQLEDPEAVGRMIDAQRRLIDPSAAERIAEFVERTVEG